MAPLHNLEPLHAQGMGDLSGNPQPKPQLITCTGSTLPGAATQQPPSTTQPIFSVVAPGDWFGFRLPSTG